MDRKQIEDVPVRDLVDTDADTNAEAALESLPRSRLKIQQFLLKVAMELVFWRPSVEFFACGPHRWASLCYYRMNNHPGVAGHVALSIDDAPCRFSDNGKSRLKEVLTMLDEFRAKATFMTVGSFLHPSHDQDMLNLLRAGHELGNHGMEDRAYDADSPEDFASAVDQCSSRIKGLQRRAGVPERVSYFRAPHGKYTIEMEKVLRSRNLVNVMCDTYSSCPIVEDGAYIGQLLSKRAQSGSIILLHMPERGFRDYCLEALRILLAGLQRRNLRLVTIGRLQELAEGGGSTSG